MTKKTAFIGERHGANLDDKPLRLPAFFAYDPNHVPYNKRRGEVDSSNVRVIVMDYNGRKPDAWKDAWTEIQLEETTKSHSGTIQTRVISVTLDAEQRALLRAYLDERENHDWKEVK